MYKWNQEKGPAPLLFTAITESILHSMKWKDYFQKQKQKNASHTHTHTLN